jgi:PST family polysaccharide transporter
MADSTKTSGYGRILRTSFIMGGASVLSLIFGVARLKAAAVILGPVGVGVIGLLQSLLMTASTVASLGIENVGARQIADAGTADDQGQIHSAKVALYVAALALSIIGPATFWLLKDTISRSVGLSELGDVDLGLIAIGIGFSVISAANIAYLNGVQRIGDIARVTISAGLIGSVGAVFSLLFWNSDALAAFIVAVPLATAIMSTFYAKKYIVWRWRKLDFPSLTTYWKTMLFLGAAIVSTTLVGSLLHLAIRSYIQNEAGSHSLGIFQSAWVISAAYISFILTAMTKDYYPRLVACLRHELTARDLINDQSEVAVLLAAPVLIVLVGFAPWIVRAMYSEDFLPSASILRWQAFGDALRVLSFPLALVVLAKGKGWQYFALETGALLVWCVAIWFGLPHFGLHVTGLAYLLMFVFYLPSVLLFVRAHLGFAWRRSILFTFWGTLVLMGAVAAVASQHEVGAMILAAIGATLFAVVAAMRLKLMAEVLSIVRQKWSRR